MKIRVGFVSNSSSSSFTLIVPKGTTDEEMRAMIEKKVGKMDTFFMKDFRQNLIDTIMDCKGDKTDLKKDLEWEDKWIAENPGCSTTDRDALREKIDSGKDYYFGGFSDNGDGALQYFLCETPFKVEDENFFMENESGY